MWPFLERRGRSASRSSEAWRSPSRSKRSPPRLDSGSKWNTSAAVGCSAATPRPGRAPPSPADGERDGGRPWTVCRWPAGVLGRLRPRDSITPGRGGATTSDSVSSWLLLSPPGSSLDPPALRDLWCSAAAAAGSAKGVGCAGIAALLRETFIARAGGPSLSGCTPRSAHRLSKRASTEPKPGDAASCG